MTSPNGSSRRTGWVNYRDDKHRGLDVSVVPVTLL